MEQKHTHFIGIGGIGMSALAKILLEKNQKVSGSDLYMTKTTQNLEACGAVIYQGHKSIHVKAGMEVVYSSSIAQDNPELQKAQALNLKIYHRSECLDQLMQSQKALLITGAHGKTSTTALVATLLIDATLDPSFVVGGYVKHPTTNGKHGYGEYFVAEADESDGSFLKSKGWGAIITNTDEDHLDYWKSKQKLLEAYQLFIEQTKNPELLFLCAEDPFLLNLRVQGCYYGFAKEAHLRITQVRQEGFYNYFDLIFEGRVYKDFKMSLQGKHQVLNATAAIGMALKLGVSEQSIKNTLMHYQGVKRRLEFLGEEANIKIFDDYAHHPTEIITTLMGLKKALPSHRLIVVFQPHRYTRLQHQLLEFAQAFSLADLCVLTEVYSAGEVPIKNVNTDALMSQMVHPNVRKVSYETLIDTLTSLVQPADVLVTMGAGDITKYGALLLTKLKGLHEK